MRSHNYYEPELLMLFLFIKLSKKGNEAQSVLAAVVLIAVF